MKKKKSLGGNVYGGIAESYAFMPRKSLDYEEYPHANSAEVAPEGRFWPFGVAFGEFEGVEARSQGNRGINSVGWVMGVKNIIVFKQRGVCFV